MPDAFSQDLISIEAKNLSPEDRLRLADHIAAYRHIYNAVTYFEDQTLEDLAVSSLKIERVDETVCKIQRSIRAESRLAWDSVVASRIASDKKQFSSHKSQPQWAGVRTSQLALEIAGRWEQFADYVARGKKHLIPLDQFIAILDHEGLSHRLEAMDTKALWLTARFLAHNSRKSHFVELWLKIKKIRDASTVVEQLNDLTDALPDQAAVDHELHAHATARATFWREHAQALEADTDAEKQAFLESYQGSRQSREQLRFQLSCRRFEVAHNTRLRRVIERLIKSRESKLTGKSRNRSTSASIFDDVNASGSENRDEIDKTYATVSDNLCPESADSTDMQIVSTDAKPVEVPDRPRKSRFSDADTQAIQDAIDKYVATLPEHERNAPDFEARKNDPWFMVEATNAMRIQSKKANTPLLMPSEIALDTGPITFAHLESKAPKGPHFKDLTRPEKPVAVRELPRRLFRKDRARGRPPDG
ncbi:MAG: hypothetical protein ACKO5E_03980 [bacterium]